MCAVEKKLKTFSAYTPTKRHEINIDRSELHKGVPFKKLTTSLNAKSGRNNYGNITVRHRSGGHKKRYRIIDFKRNKFDVEATVETVEYDPNRSAFIALLKYADGEYRYIIAPDGLKVGDKVISSKELVDVKIGNAMPLRVIPIGTIIHNIEEKPGAGAAVIRSAGCFAQLSGKDGGNAVIRLHSKEIKLFPLDCMATIGSVSNTDNKNKAIGKAGRSRWLGVRPHVRGVAMNPVDHPHGGGEGKTAAGRHPVSYSGVLAKGGRTRNQKKLSNKRIVRSRHSKK